ncbi:MAG: hypothetical protein FWF49_02425 [Oscillospiraceae bacterium]|nr:hypothetical protein [Oscillospiraceae bacterium]
MAQKLYGHMITPACEYCRYGRRTQDKASVLCPKKGMVPLYHNCRRFTYDPLKRVPSAVPMLTNFQQKDFQIK